MKVVQFIVALALAVGLLTAGFVKPAHADTAEQSQHLNQNYDVTCDVSGYGQSTCHVLGSQTADQSQKITLRNGIAPHKVVDTGLDLPMLAGSAATIMTGVGAAVIKFKNRV